MKRNYFCLVISFAILFAYVECQNSPCPKYPMCQVKDRFDDCVPGQGPEECPGGQPACIRNAETSEIESCCCILFNSKYKHLTTGDPKPFLRPGTLRTYYMRFCPFSQRVMLTTKVKQINVDDIYVNLKYKADWFVWPLGGGVPIIERPQGHITNDLIEVDYLDEDFSYPRKLHSSDPFQKAMDRQLADKYNKYIPSALFDILYGTGLTDPTQVPQLMENFENFLSGYADELSRRGTRFFGGNEYPGYLDYIMWPWIERREIFPAFYPRAYDYNATSKKLGQWSEAMKGDDTIQQFLFSKEVHYEYAKSVRAGEPNYDMIAGF